MENLGLIVIIVVGFVVKGVDVKNFRLGESSFREAVAKLLLDVQGGEVMIRREER